MDFTRITEFLDTLKDEGIPSADVMIFKNHECIYRHMTGTVDAEGQQAVSADTQYLMFSMTKVQTMTAFMQLVEQGKLSFEDEVGKYLPAYRDLTVVREENGQKITEPAVPMLMKHLVSMQSGLDYDLGRAGILRVLKEKGDAATTLDLVNAFTETPLNFQPGSHFCYSLSHDVVAAVIEVVSGMSFGEYLKKNIWEPLGMTRTYFAKPMNDGSPNLAQQFTYDFEKNKIVPMEQSCCYQLSASYESGGAGLISCTEDYAKLGDALACGGIGANGARILKAESVEKIKENLLCEASQEEIIRNMGRLGYKYGVGMQVLTNPELIGSPACPGVFGWDGAAGSAVMMETGTATAIVFTMHVRSCGAAYGKVHPMLRDLVFGE